MVGRSSSYDDHNRCSFSDQGRADIFAAPTIEMKRDPCRRLRRSSASPRAQTDVMNVRPSIQEDQVYREIFAGSGQRLRKMAPASSAASPALVGAPRRIALEQQAREHCRDAFGTPRRLLGSSTCFPSNEDDFLTTKRRPWSASPPRSERNHVPRPSTLSPRLASPCSDSEASYAHNLRGTTLDRSESDDGGSGIVGVGSPGESESFSAVDWVGIFGTPRRCRKPTGTMVRSSVPLGSKVVSAREKLSGLPEGDPYAEELSGDQYRLWAERTGKNTRTVVPARHPLLDLENAPAYQQRGESAQRRGLRTVPRQCANTSAPTSVKQAVEQTWWGLSCVARRQWSRLGDGGAGAIAELDRFDQEARNREVALEKKRTVSHGRTSDINAEEAKVMLHPSRRLRGLRSTVQTLAKVRDYIGAHKAQQEMLALERQERRTKISTMNAKAAQASRAKRVAGEMAELAAFQADLVSRLWQKVLKGELPNIYIA
eukprot:TRINITY_DN29118_c0_g1_i1.p1 TRINITY_DN29118_c0_g1~~TRINITY_DN29118_c0_g1_i1.p1  ORF type:complete len:507 (-),score=58.32 TRINITY_DN29118_c0_g1_i1:64-1521(-)